jgi:hypothetical protein
MLKNVGEIYSDEKQASQKKYHIFTLFKILCHHHSSGVVDIKAGKM